MYVGDRAVMNDKYVAAEKNRQYINIHWRIMQ